MSRYRALYDRNGILAEFENDVLVWHRADAKSGKSASIQVVRDIEPYKSMITGEMIGSRSRHRDHLRAHGCIEIGNEVAAAMKRPDPPRKDTRRQMLHSILGDKSDKQIHQIVKDHIRGRS